MGLHLHKDRNYVLAVVQGCLQPGLDTGLLVYSDKHYPSQQIDRAHPSATRF